MSEGLLTLSLWLGIFLWTLYALEPALKGEHCQLQFMKDIENWLLSPEKPSGITPFEEVPEGYIWSHHTCRTRSFSHP